MGYIDELLSRAKADKKRIVLPEPMDKRTYEAAEKLLAQDIADIIIIATKEEIETYGAGYDISKATIVDPFNDPNKQKYIDMFVHLRGHKGVTPEAAKLQMEQDYMYYACLMCKCGDADGAVSGACHSTGNTIRPALQLLKTKPGISGVSGFFIMEVPDCELGENGLFVFADCAVNPDNDAEKMAETAGLSAENFEAFIGKKAKVALLSFSTKGSATHDRVTMVQEASELAKKHYPLYEIDGELQLDAALIPEIGEMKAPGSSVAGHANTLIFPDLESGNIGYKLVQRLAKANAYGPLLQGLSMPVNDLSRGCSADDIVATVAMTAIQAQMEDRKNKAKGFNIYGARINGQGDENMKILVVNCGSSSLKYQLIDAQSEEVLAKGLCERIGIEGSMFTYTKTGSDKITLQVNQPDHKTSISLVLRALTDKDHGVIGDLSEIGAVGHRLVHGGEEFAASTLITDEVLKAVESCNDLAPLHNPANIIGVNACRELMPETPMVGVFDTAFHQTMPPEAFIYGIPYEYYKKDKVRKYGFHGTSHAYVSRRTAEILGLDYDKAKIIVCHLGNGASICAVDGGKSVETSMGLTPLMGLVMGTRSGEIDPGVMEYLGKKENMSFEEIMTMLNKRSGVLGISGVSSDFRDVDQAADDGNSQAQLALQVYTHRVRSYIGSYIAVMNGVDAIVFTAGVGENDPVCRQQVIKNFGFIGAYIDEEKNNIRGKEAVISTDDSKVKILVVPTNEELMIARDTKRIVEEMNK